MKLCPFNYAQLYIHQRLLILAKLLNSDVFTWDGIPDAMFSMVNEIILVINKLNPQLCNACIQNIRNISIPAYGFLIRISSRQVTSLQCKLDPERISIIKGAYQKLMLIFLNPEIIISEGSQTYGVAAILDLWLIRRMCKLNEQELRPQLDKCYSRITNTQQQKTTLEEIRQIFPNFLVEKHSTAHLLDKLSKKRKKKKKKKSNSRKTTIQTDNVPPDTEQPPPPQAAAQPAVTAAAVTTGERCRFFTEQFLQDASTTHFGNGVESFLKEKYHDAILSFKLAYNDLLRLDNLARHPGIRDNKICIFAYLIIAYEKLKDINSANLHWRRLQALAPNIDIMGTVTQGGPVSWQSHSK
jgi:hypothetical protein